MTLTRVESPVDATGGHLGFKSSESSLGRRVIILSNLLPNLSNPLRAGDWAGGTVWVLSSRLQQNQRENVQSLRVKVNWNMLCPRIQKHFPESRLWDVFWIRGPVLDSGKCFWIVGSVLDSVTCFGFREVFLDCGKCFVLMSHRMSQTTRLWNQSTSEFI